MIVLVMGVAGVGKTTIGEALARALGWRFIDADDYHPPENVAKMKAGIPLDDEDRWPWLQRLNGILKDEQNAVLACSALKESYRRRLAAGLEDFKMVYLHGERRADPRAHGGAKASATCRRRCWTANSRRSSRPPTPSRSTSPRR